MLRLLSVWPSVLESVEIKIQPGNNKNNPQSIMYIVDRKKLTSHSDPHINEMLRKERINLFNPGYKLLNGQALFHDTSNLQG